MDRYFCFSLCILCIFGSASASDFLDDHIIYFENHFNKTVECVKKILAVGDITRGIPALDPWKSSKTIDLNLDNKFIWTKLKLYDLVVDGLLSFNTVSILLTPLLQLDMSFHFKSIKVNGRYSGEFNLVGMIGLFGEGDLNLKFEDIDVNTTTQFRMVPPLFGHQRSLVSMGKAKISITGINSDEDMSRSFSNLASITIPKLINGYEKDISDTISPFIKDMANMYIGNFSFLNLLAIVTQYACE